MTRAAAINMRHLEPWLRNTASVDNTATELCYTSRACLTSSTAAAPLAFLAREKNLKPHITFKLLYIQFEEFQLEN